MTTTAIPITSLDDLKDLPKKISEAIEGAFRSDSSIHDKTSRDSTVFKMNATEFEELGIKIGDKITLEIKISNNNDIKA
jgi:formylmethanofuran dehydrogenase subunit D